MWMLYPQMKSAGIVKMIPDAKEELAEPVVWEILHSKIVDFPMIGDNIRNIATDTTARGIAVLIVSPTLNPR